MSTDPNREDVPMMPEPEGYRGPMGSANDPQFEVVGICHRCRHRGSDPFRCKAFPDGIPNVILVGEYVHIRPFQGDGGVLFSPKGGIA